MLQTPLAFIVFNRPDLTARVFEEIRRVRPRKLLLVADGPRPDRPGEMERCAATRSIIESVDWPCEILKNYSDSNLGCRKRVSSGIDWIFQQVEEAIILEDDCLPDSSFFAFCSELLNRYRNDPRVMMISGDNFQPNKWKSDYSYYFSRYAHIWGWATWRRAWKLYDVDMARWPELRNAGWLSEKFEAAAEAEFWAKRFDAVYNRELDTWDYQWNFACFKSSALSIMPAGNLISNIGFGKCATHTRESGPLADLPTRPIGHLRHPAAVERSVNEDIYTFNHVISSNLPPSKGRYLGRMGRSVKRRAGNLIRLLVG